MSAHLPAAAAECQRGRGGDLAGGTEILVGQGPVVCRQFFVKMKCASGSVTAVALIAAVRHLLGI
jgi:hypothetical protein